MTFVSKLVADGAAGGDHPHNALLGVAVARVEAEPVERRAVHVTRRGREVVLPEDRRDQHRELHLREVPTHAAARPVAERHERPACPAHRQEFPLVVVPLRTLRPERQGLLPVTVVDRQIPKRHHRLGAGRDDLSAKLRRAGTKHTRHHRRRAVDAHGLLEAQLRVLQLREVGVRQGAVRGAKDRVHLLPDALHHQRLLREAVDRVRHGTADGVEPGEQKLHEVGAQRLLDGLRRSITIFLVVRLEEELEHVRTATLLAVLLPARQAAAHNVEDHAVRDAALLLHQPVVLVVRLVVRVQLRVFEGERTARQFAGEPDVGLDELAPVREGLHAVDVTPVQRLRRRVQVVRRHQRVRVDLKLPARRLADQRVKPSCHRVRRATHVVAKVRQLALHQLTAHDAAEAHPLLPLEDEKHLRPEESRRRRNQTRPQVVLDVLLQQLRPQLGRVHQKPFLSELSVVAHVLANLPRLLQVLVQPTDEVRHRQVVAQVGQAHLREHRRRRRRHRRPCRRCRTALSVVEAQLEVRLRLQHARLQDRLHRQRHILRELEYGAAEDAHQRRLHLDRCQQKAEAHARPAPEWRQEARTVDSRLVLAFEAKRLEAHRVVSTGAEHSRVPVDTEVRRRDARPLRNVHTPNRNVGLRVHPHVERRRRLVPLRFLDETIQVRNLAGIVQRETARLPQHLEDFLPELLLLLREFRQVEQNPVQRRVRRVVRPVQEADHRADRELPVEERHPVVLTLLEKEREGVRTVTLESVAALRVQNASADLAQFSDGGDVSGVLRLLLLHLVGQVRPPVRVLDTVRVQLTDLPPNVLVRPFPTEHDLSHDVVNLPPELGVGVDLGTVPFVESLLEGLDRNFVHHLHRRVRADHLRVPVPDESDLLHVLSEQKVLLAKVVQHGEQ
eukprot:Hpha_TRINITY_DN15762_c0_g2::TRINITY_DN15762_c0_g2_i1::g.41773::m.41773